MNIKHVVYSAIIKANEQANMELFGDVTRKDPPEKTPAPLPPKPKEDEEELEC